MPYIGFVTSSGRERLLVFLLAVAAFNCGDSGSQSSPDGGAQSSNGDQDSGRASDAEEFSGPALCPSNPTAVIPERVCSEERESASGKVTSEALQKAAARPGARVSVLITLREPPGKCELVPCPTRQDEECPSRAAYAYRWKAENLAWEKCVRQMLEQVVGTGTYINPESYEKSVVIAALTEPQLRTVATHTDVATIGLLYPEPTKR